MNVEDSVDLGGVERGRRCSAGGAPVVLDDCVQDLIEKAAVPQKRLSQDAFLDRADLQQRGIGAPLVRGGRASSRCTPMVSNANARSSSALSRKTPVPQKAEPTANPHSAVLNHCKTSNRAHLTGCKDCDAVAGAGSPVPAGS